MGAVGQAALGMLAVLVTFIYYRWSVRRHPWTHCRRCGGRSRHYDAVFEDAFGDCRACGGRGKKLRWGARLFTTKD